MIRLTTRSDGALTLNLFKQSAMTVINTGTITFQLQSPFTPTHHHTALRTCSTDCFAPKMNHINVQKLLIQHHHLHHPAATLSNELVRFTNLSKNSLNIRNDTFVLTTAQRKQPKHDKKQQRKEDFSPLG